MRDHQILIATALFASAATASLASAQSDPAGFGTVFNVGTVPSGSMFDVPGAATGPQVGDGTVVRGQSFITPTFLGGDTLGSDSQLNVFAGGEVLSFFSAGPSNGTGSNIEVNIAGGSVGRSFFALRGSTVNVSGGVLGLEFQVVDGGAANISGGSIGDLFSVGFGSTANISGGSFGDRIRFGFGSTVNLSGTAFFLDGVEITGLVLDQAFTITDRDATLTGVLSDGSAFDFDLNSDFDSEEDFFDTGAALTVTLVPAPSTAGILGVAGFAAVRRRRGSWDRGGPITSWTFSITCRSETTSQSHQGLSAACPA